MKSAITIRDIHKSYGALHVLKGISLEIPAGEVMAIVGPSGAGKTTLLQIIGSLERPDSGTVSYGSSAIFDLGERRLARFRNENIGFVFQFHQLLPEFTLLENVEMPALIGGASASAARKRAMEIISYLGLTERSGHKPAQLSGGECQRAAVARALINNPEVILADEPSGSLDSRNRRELHDLFFRLRDERNQTFVIVTHDESLAAECDSVVHMADGLVTDLVNRRTQSM